MILLLAIYNFFRYYLAYVFVPLLEQELHEFKDAWNSHTIRKSKISDSPGGKPEDLLNYDIPEAYGRLCQ